MSRIIALIASTAVIASITAVAAECTSDKGIDATRTLSATERNQPAQPANAAEKEKACRAYAASFYESVMRRRAAARHADGGRTLALLDSVIDAFNELLATKCGG